MDEGHLTNVFDLTYIKMVQFTLSCIGAWPNKKLGDRSRLAKILSIYNFCLMMTCATAMAFEFKYLKKYTGVQDFTALGHTYITLFMGCLFVQRLTMPMQEGYCNVTKEFLTKFHLIHYKTKSKYSEKMNERVQKICFIFSVMSHFQLYTGVFFYNLIPLFQNYNSGMFSENRPVNGTFEQAIFYDLPIDQYTDTFWFFIVSTFNVYLSFTVCCAFCCFDLLICLKVFHIWGHLNILKDSINNFRRPEQHGTVESPPWFTGEETKEVHKELSDLIIYHKMITDWVWYNLVRGWSGQGYSLILPLSCSACTIVFMSEEQDCRENRGEKRFMAQTSSAYSVFLYVYFIFHQVSGCVLLLEVSKMDAEALGKYGLLTVTQFGQLILLSIVFELISTKGETIIEDVYGLPWECMDSRNRKIVAFFLQNVQKPMAIKAGDMVPVGVQTMFAIIKASCSYFVMLTTFAQEEG